MRISWYKANLRGRQYGMVKIGLRNDWMAFRRAIGYWVRYDMPRWVKLRVGALGYRFRSFIGTFLL